MPTLKLCLMFNHYEHKDKPVLFIDTPSGTLWEGVAHHDICHVMTDYWKPYELFLPPELHTQSKAETFTVEGYNSAIGCADDRRRIIRVKFLERCASYLSTSYAHLIVLCPSYRVIAKPRLAWQRMRQVRSYDYKH